MIYSRKHLQHFCIILQYLRLHQSINIFRKNAYLRCAGRSNNTCIWGLPMRHSQLWPTGSAIERTVSEEFLAISNLQCCLLATGKNYIAGSSRQTHANETVSLCTFASASFYIYRIILNKVDKSRIDDICRTCYANLYWKRFTQSVEEIPVTFIYVLRAAEPLRPAGVGIVAGCWATISTKVKNCTSDKKS